MMNTPPITSSIFKIHTTILTVSDGSFHESVVTINYNADTIFIITVLFSGQGTTAPTYVDTFSKSVLIEVP